MITTVDQTNFRQYDISMQNTLNLRVMQRWEELLDYFKIEYYISNDCVLSTCPIHGGDNPNALNIYFNGFESNEGNFTGKWVCNTHQCHEEFTPNIIGLTQGLLSRQKLGWSTSGDKTITFNSAIDFLISFLGTDYVSLKNTSENFGQNSHQTFTNQVNKIFNRQVDKKKYKITRKEIQQKLEIPAQYYIERGYSPEILKLYDVGLCNNPEQKMNQRVVVPIYDKDGDYVGCSGRSTNGKQPKWLHSQGLKTGEHLYNYHLAKKYIKTSQVMIMVEGVGDVLRLEQCGINNSVGLFGVAISQGQQDLVNSSGALSLIVLLDSDEAGIKGMRKIKKDLGRLYRLYFPTISGNDVGEMCEDSITEEIKPLIDKINLER